MNIMRWMQGGSEEQIRTNFEQIYVKEDLCACPFDRKPLTTEKRRSHKKKKKNSSDKSISEYSNRSDYA